MKENVCGEQEQFIVDEVYPSYYEQISSIELQFALNSECTCCHRRTRA